MDINLIHFGAISIDSLIHVQFGGEACIHGDLKAFREQTGHPVQEELATIN